MYVYQLYMYTLKHVQNNVYITLTLFPALNEVSSGSHRQLLLTGPRRLDLTTPTATPPLAVLLTWLSSDGDPLEAEQRENGQTVPKEGIMSAYTRGRRLSQGNTCTHMYMYVHIHYMWCFGEDWELNLTAILIAKITKTCTVYVHVHVYSVQYMCNFTVCMCMTYTDGDVGSVSISCVETAQVHKAIVWVLWNYNVYKINFTMYMYMYAHNKNSNRSIIGMHMYSVHVSQL